MCDPMEIFNWESVLVDWVNCLQLYKPIEKVEELRDGVFIRNLRKIIKNTTDPIPDDDLTIIFNLFSCRYPKIKFQEVESIHINDLPHDDLVNLISLLMHDICVYDRKNVLTCPMCCTLSPITQMHIKNFLEMVNEETSTEELSEIIKSVCADSKQMMPEVDTSLAKKSPLQDILRTPVGKNKTFNMKDGLINKLTNELYVEKHERAEIEDELKQQLEKIQKLEASLKGKYFTIKQLEAELESFEKQKSLHAKDLEFQQTQKLLTIEIESLEMCVQQCNAEKEELKTENDTAKAKVSDLKMKFCACQKKLVEAEEKLQFFVDQCTELENKNEFFMAHCQELEDLLQEYQCKRSNSLDDSLQVAWYSKRRSKSLESVQPEDLAHSVVDVQLREVQKKLEDTLQDLDFVSGEKCELEKILQDTKQENGRFQEQLTNANKEIIELSLTKENLEKDLFKERTVRQEIETALVDKKKHCKEILENMSLKLQCCENERDEALGGLADIKMQLEEAQSKLTSVGEDLVKVTVEKGWLRDQLSDTIGELENCRAKVEELKKTLGNTEFLLKQRSEHLQNVEAEKGRIWQENKCYMDKLDDVYAEKAKIEGRLAETVLKLKDISEILQIRTEELESVQKRFAEALEVSEELKMQKDGLKNELLRTVEHLDVVYKNLDEISQSKKDLEQKMEEKNKKLAEADCLLKNKSEQLENQLKQALEVSEKIKIEKEHVENDLFKQVKTLEEDLAAANRKSEEILCSKTDLECMMAKKRQELVEANHLLKNKYDELENHLQGVFEALEQLKIDKERTEDALLRKVEALERDLDIVNKNLGEVINSKTDLQHKLAEKAQEMAKSEQLLKNKGELENLLKQALESLEKLEVRKENMENGFSKEVKILKEHLSVTNKKLEEISRSKADLECMLAEKSQELNQTNQLLKHKCEELQSQVETSEQLKIQIEIELSNAAKALKEELAAANTNLETVSNAKLSLEHKLTEQSLELVKLSTEKVQIVSEKLTVEADLNKLIKQLNKAQEDIKTLKLDKEITTKQLEETEEQLAETFNQLETISNRKIGLEEELAANGTKLKALQDEAEKASFVHNELLQRLGQGQSQLQEIKTVKDALESKLNNTVALLKNTSDKLSQNEEVLTQTKLEKTILENKFKETSQTLNEKCRELKSFETRLQESQLKNNKLTKDFEDLEAYAKQVADSLDEVVIEKERMLETTERMKNENETLKEEKDIYYEKLEANVQELQTAKEELDKHLSEIKSLKQALTLAQGEKQYFSNLFEELAKKLELSDQRAATATLEVKELMLDLQNVNEEKRLLKDTLDKTIDKLELSETTVNQLQERLDKIQEEKTVISNFLDLNNDELMRVTEERDQILKALEMSNRDKLELEKENEELGLKLFSLTDAKEEASRLLKDKAEILENLQKLIKEKEELFSELGNQSAQLEALKKEYAALQSDYQDLQNGRSDNESEIKKLLLSNIELSEHLEAAKRDREQTFVNFKQVQKQQKDLENEFKKIFVEKQDIAKEKNDIYDFLQKSVEEKEVVILERDRLQADCTRLTQERDALYEKLQNTAEEKQKILLSLELSQKEALKIKKERNDILQSQTEIMKETESNILRAHEAAVEEKKELFKRVENAETERDKIRAAYGKAIAANSRYELETASLKKMVESHNEQIKKFANIKEAYEKLLEDNGTYITEVESLRYKRAKDRDEYLRLLKKEREDGEARESKRIKAIRAEYEEKLEKMKEKMLTLYREEVNKEKQKVKNEQGDSVFLQNVIDSLRSELSRLQQKLHVFESSKEQPKDHYVSLESLHSVKPGTLGLKGRGNKVADRDSILGRDSCAREQLHRIKSVSNINGRESVNVTLQDKKIATLPSRFKPGDFIEETITLSRRTSINSIGRNLEMEDEQDDMFNNKYLTDLKEGRCLPSTGRESNFSRMSELVWRNSMVPPHLKSSYPAEMQFISPTRFKDDDLKTGTIDLDGSMARLLPADKPRQKKDFGTTSYKKPGPPTPSKNGGRPSLQGNEIQPLKESNSRTSMTPKKITPKRFKTLFKGSKEGNTENVTPRTTSRLRFLKTKK